MLLWHSANLLVPRKLCVCVFIVFCLLLFFLECIQHSAAWPEGALEGDTSPCSDPASRRLGFLGVRGQTLALAATGRVMLTWPIF